MQYFQVSYFGVDIRKEFEVEDLIKGISEKTIVSIKDKEYVAKAKAYYVTQSSPKKWYVKVFFEGLYVLVLSPSDNFIYFGKDIGSIGYDYPTPKRIEFNGRIFKKITEDYQIMIKYDFGSPINIEGEVKFIDYECIDNDNLFVSVGLIVRTNSRADIYAEIVNLNDVRIKL